MSQGGTLVSLSKSFQRTFCSEGRHPHSGGLGSLRQFQKREVWGCFKGKGEEYSGGPHIPLSWLDFSHNQKTHNVLQGVTFCFVLLELLELPMASGDPHPLLLLI